MLTIKKICTSPYAKEELMLEIFELVKSMNHLFGQNKIIKNIITKEFAILKVFDWCFFSFSFLKEKIIMI